MTRRNLTTPRRPGLPPLVAELIAAAGRLDAEGDALDRASLASTSRNVRAFLTDAVYQLNDAHSNVCYAITAALVEAGRDEKPEE